MSKMFCAVVVLSLIIGCYKPPSINPRVPTIYLDRTNDSAYMSIVKMFVQQHPELSVSNDIDFENYRISKFKKCWYLRLPIKGSVASTDFIVLQTDSSGKVSDGRIIHLEALKNAAAVSPRDFNGYIVIQSLNHKSVVASKVTGGFIETFHPSLFNADSRINNSNKAESFPVPYDELPEVVVVAYLPAASSSGGISFGDYMMLQSMFSGGGSGGGSTGSGGSGSSGGGGGGGGNGAADYGYGVYSPVDYGDPSTPHPTSGGVSSSQGANINLQYDESFFRPAIDLNAWLKCFTDIPDEGASCSIMLLGDLPDESNPSLGMNLWNGNTGHCFLQLSKSNGTQSVNQIIGFTAQSPFKAIVNTDAYVPSKIVDNAGHKYDCLINMPLTPAGMRMVMTTIVNQADMPYSVDRYDCLDFALDVFNSVRGTNKLVIDKTRIANDPFSNVANGPKLYALLQNMVDNQSPDMQNISLGGPQHAGVSHGPCY